MNEEISEEERKKGLEGPETKSGGRTLSVEANIMGISTVGAWRGAINANHGETREKRRGELETQ